MRPDGSICGGRIDTRSRPLWKRLGARARLALYRAATPLDRILRWRSTTLLPPAHLRLFYYGTWNTQTIARASAVARAELLSRGLHPEHRVLDIGSGVGVLALGLIGYLRGGYDGIEIHREAVAWCQQAISRRYPDFRFHHADLASRAYNPDGKVFASTYQFPFPTQSFDFIVLASVFTHMLPDGVEHYLMEISSLLAPGGTCIASFFLLNEQTRTGVDANASFMSFNAEHPSGVCRLHDATVPEAAVAYDEAFVRSAHERAGLRIRDIRRGRWWCGEAHDQDVLTVVRRIDAV